MAYSRQLVDNNSHLGYDTKMNLTGRPSTGKSGKSLASQPTRAKKFRSSIRMEDGEPEYYDTSSEGNLRAYLWSFRIKATDARIDVLEFLSKEKDPLSVRKITEKLSKSHPVATIYRVLDILTKAGILNKIDLGHDHAHYELSMGRKHHHHAVCTSCGEIEDVAGCAGEVLDDMARGLKKFRQVQSHSLEFFGLCKQCDKRSGIKLNSKLELKS